MAQDHVSVTLSLGPDLKEHVLYTALENQTMGTGFKSVVQRTFYLLWAQEETHHKAVKYISFLRNLVSLFSNHFRRGCAAGNEKLSLCYMENQLQSGWNDVPTVISLVKQILAQDLAKWGRKQRMKRRMELIMCPKWGICRHHRKGSVIPQTWIILWCICEMITLLCL